MMASSLRMSSSSFVYQLTTGHYCALLGMQWTLWWQMPSRLVVEWLLRRGLSHDLPHVITHRDGHADSCFGALCAAVHGISLGYLPQTVALSISVYSLVLDQLGSVLLLSGQGKTQSRDIVRETTPTVVAFYAEPITAGQYSYPQSFCGIPWPRYVEHPDSWPISLLAL